MSFKFILLSLILLFVNQAELKKVTINASTYLNKRCLLQAAKSLNYQEVAALICGKKINDPQIKELFVVNGLIHIFVVSGAHLSFYKKLFRLIFPDWAAGFLTSSFLLLYTLTCSFTAPIFRAFIEQLNSNFNKLFKLNLNKYIIQLATALICIVVEPDYLKSVSLPMSWVAAMTMSMKDRPGKTLIVFLSLFPILLTFTEPNPLSAFTSFFISGFVSLFILPLNLIIFLVPKLDFILSLFYDLFYILLDLIQPTSRTQETSSYSDLTTIICWVYALVMNIVIIFKSYRLKAL